MGEIYVYAQDADDFDSTGLVGCLHPTEWKMNIDAGTFGELTMKHPRDALGQWRALTAGAILKAPVPMRLCPNIRSDGTYVTSIETWKVDPNATEAERAVYKKADKKKKVSTIPAGLDVQVILSHITRQTTQIKASSTTTDRKGRKKTTTYSGWVDTSLLQATTVPVKTIPATSAGAEEANRSYAVREQLFRIDTVSVSDDNGGTIKVDARRIPYDLLGNLSTYNNSQPDITGREAAQGVLANTVVPHDFSLYSDVGDTRSLIDARDLNPIDALCDPEKGIAARWGAELVSDDFDIYMLHRVGLDRDYRIEYGKNLLGITCETDISDMATGIRPSGEDENGFKFYLNGTETLPTGYSHCGNGIISPTSLRNATLKKIAPLAVSDAKMSKDVSEALARSRMVTAAVNKFEEGGAQPKISLKVDFVMLGDTEEYRQFKHLESLFIYDTVHIRHVPMGISADVALVSLEWDGIAERVTKAEFGSLAELTGTVASWQIGSGIGGDKLLPGTVSGAALGDESIKARHVQAESINADALNVQDLTATEANINKLKAAWAELVSAYIQSLTTAQLTTDALAAQFVRATEANFGTIVAGAASLTEANVQHLIANVFNLTGTGVAPDFYIYNLKATYAQMMSAMMDMLVVKGDDGEYYTVHIANGEVSATVYTGGVDEGTGMTTDGTRALMRETMPTGILSGHTVAAVEGVINTLWADLIDAPTIRTRQLFGDGGTLEIIADQSKKAESLYDEMEDYRLNFHFDENGLRIQREDAAGTPVSVYSTLTDNYGFHIQQDGEKIASMARHEITAEAFRVGRASETDTTRIVMRLAGDGGIVFVPEERTVSA